MVLQSPSTTYKISQTRKTCHDLCTQDSVFLLTDFLAWSNTRYAWYWVISILPTPILLKTRTPKIKYMPLTTHHRDIFDTENILSLILHMVHTGNKNYNY